MPRQHILLAGTLRTAFLLLGYTFLSNILLFKNNHILPYQYLCKDST
jgi:hypothetical protein